MTGAIEGPHAAIVLGPYDEVLELGVVGGAGLQHLAHVPPVHADEVDRAVRAVRSEIGKGRRQKDCELIARHLARRHRKFAMADFAEAADVAFDRDVVGRIGEDHLGLLAVHQGGDDSWIERVAASKPVRSKPPDVAKAAARGSIVRIRKPVVCRIASLLRRKAFDKLVDLGDREAGDTRRRTRCRPPSAPSALAPAAPRPIRR